MFAQTTIIGHLGGAPAMRYAPEGTPMTTVSVATTQGYGEKKTTVWYRVTFWNKTAEAVNNYCDKGDLIMAIGTIRDPKPWQDKEGNWRCSLEMSGHECKFLQTKKKEEGGQAQSAEQPATARAAAKPAAAKPGPAETEEAAW
jgi:single-strand DNA-binding protein